MTISAAALRELHRIHRQLADLRERLERGPKQVRAGKEGLQRLEQTTIAAKETLTRARVAADEKQLQLQQREDRITDLKTKLNVCNSNKEYQALVEQIGADEQANSVLSDEILEALEELDTHQANVAKVEQHVVKAKQDLEKLQQQVNQQQAGLESELARVMGELEKSEAQLPSDFKAEYQRLVKARGENTLAPVEGDCCGGCYFTLTPQMMNELYMSKPVFCKNCGALLYFTEDRSPS